MTIKAAFLILYTLIKLWGLFLIGAEHRSCSNPIPENVRDVYDAETYARWRAYQSEKTALSVALALTSLALNLILYIANAHAWAASLLGGNIYSELFALELFAVLVGTLVGIPFSWYDDMVIEQKYGFNRMTKKTFIADQIKSLVISLLLLTVVTAALAAIHTALGDWMLPVFTGALFAFALGIAFLYPVFSKIFNKFTELEDGELREKLTALLERHDYKVRGIKVMDASRRSSKSNAYFTGFGRMKTIVLYDTLLETMDTDEICAVFAHEMGHGLHRDTLRTRALSLVRTFLLVLILWLTLRAPALFAAFGFAGINYAFAFELTAIFADIALLPMDILFAWMSRRAEYRADAQAVEEGYGETLIRALKKLTAKDFGLLTPSRLLVVLEYSHPPLSERVAAIEKGIRSKGNGA